MYPYLERVLQLPLNWMIHSTALLERSWLEYDRRKTFDRAMLQIQALLDQHSTKLTISQSTFKSIEEAAPVEDRLQFLNCIVYPAQYELKRDLAFKYLRGQVFVSALNLFKELELWDEVVQCYQLLDKPQRAEILVRERLKAAETPYMLTVLADLTGNEDLYERAWLLSRNRFARAKRTLARICYDRSEFTSCIQHLDAALGVQPLVATAWYLRGIACMQCELWDEGVKSFVRCVQQDMEVAEAYANIGAIHMRQRDYAKAYPALYEELKYKNDSWKIMENLVTVCLNLEKWREMVMYMNKLLDLKLKSQRPVMKPELRYLALSVATAAIAVAADNQPSPESANRQVELLNSVEKLIVRITNSIKSDPDIWDILAEFFEILARKKSILDCRMRQVRALISAVGWEKETSSVRLVLDAAQKLVSAHKGDFATKSDIYACKSILQSIKGKIDAIFNESAFSDVIKGMIAEVGELYESKLLMK